MKGKLIIDGNAVYEIDEECMRTKEKKEQQEREAARDTGDARPGGRTAGRQRGPWFRF